MPEDAAQDTRLCLGAEFRTVLPLHSEAISGAQWEFLELSRFQVVPKPFGITSLVAACVLLCKPRLPVPFLSPKGLGELCPVLCLLFLCGLGFPSQLCFAPWLSVGPALGVSVGLAPGVSVGPAPGVSVGPAVPPSVGRRELSSPCRSSPRSIPASRAEVPGCDAAVPCSPQISGLCPM